MSSKVTIFLMLCCLTAAAMADSGARPGSAASTQPSVAEAPDSPSVKVTFLGVGTESAPPALRRQVGLPEGVGLVVLVVSPKSPAEKAGVQQYDLLHKLNDQILVNGPQLAVLVRTLKAGDTAKLTVIRKGTPQTLSVELAEHDLPAAEAAIDPAAVDRGVNDLPAFRPREPILVRDNYVMSWFDGQYTVHLQSEKGKRKLIATDADQHVIYSGPVDTPAQCEQVPPELRARLKHLAVPGFEDPSTAPSTAPVPLPPP